MTFSEGDVDHVAMLARLHLTPQEREQFGAQLGAILDHVSQLQEIDTSHLPATAQVGDLVNAWREDGSRPSLSVEQALSGAPDRVGNHFRVGAIQE